MKNITEINNGKRNQILSADLSIHSWYQFVLGYPPHLVRYYLHKFDINDDDIVLDPFCGTGTTNVECLKNNIPNYGIDANLITYFASKVKTNLKLDIEELNNYLGYIYKSLQLSFNHLNIKDNSSLLFEPHTDKSPVIIHSIPRIGDEKQKIIPKGFISETPLKKVLVTKEIIDTIDDIEIRDFFILSLAKLIVEKAGNIAFGPEIYSTKPKDDIESVGYYVANTERMIGDVERFHNNRTTSIITNGDARRLDKYLDKSLLGTINCVITSPPYPNEKDYTRSTRLESVLLGFVNNKKELRDLKEHLLRSNSRNIFVSDTDGKYINRYKRICEIADEIERKRIELNKSSGFEKTYHRIVRHYFGGMYLHLKSLKPYLAEDAKLAYVVGDQMSFFKIYIPTAELLADIAESLGYEVLETELWRTRIATATKLHINENVLILKNA
ncbi:MAG: DNA methyltransferase [Nitrospiraceae bacterium]|nr:DNA methyltransferase [Nitrospiraceae bacterium]